MTERLGATEPGIRSRCRCGREFTCGIGTGACWCVDLPAVMPVPEAEFSGGTPPGCLCPDCLKAEVERRGVENRK